MAVNLSNVTIAQLEQYGDIPALAPPPGVVPNFRAHNERADVYKILCSILLAILYIFLCLRLYAKMWIKRNPGFDDLACVLAVIGLSACFALGVVMERHGVGRHQWNVPLSEIPTILQLGRYNSIILPPTMLCVKMSLLLLYLRIFSPDKVTRYLIYAGMIFCIGAYITLMFITIFSNVITLIAANKTLGVVNFTSDVYILCVPLQAVSKLQLSTKKKIGFMVIFMTGIIACAMSVVGLVFRFQVHQSEADATYLLSGTILVTTIEEEIGLMCTCMPFFPAIVNASPFLSAGIHSVASIGSLLTPRSSSSPHSSTTDRRSYQKHVASRDGSVEEGLELQHGREAVAGVRVPVPARAKETRRMEMEGFEREEEGDGVVGYEKV